MIERNFNDAAEKGIWLADITYIETDQGWLYFSFVMDLYSRRIVGSPCGAFACRAAAGALSLAISVSGLAAGLI